jgi:hypothetical protein
VSIYLPTHRHHPDNQQDPIRFRNLLDRVRASLQRLSAPPSDLLSPFEALGTDADFWTHTADGLAVFGAPGLFQTVRVQRALPERAIVADSFHVAPLLRILQAAERFQLLALSRGAVRLFEGHRDMLDEIALPDDVPRSLDDTLGAEPPEPQGQAHSYGTGPAAPGAGARRGAGGAKRGGMRHGHGSKKDVIAQQTERFFRAVDRAVLEHHSKPAGLPLVLAALPEHQGPFRALSRNPRLLDRGIEADVLALSADALRERVWPVIDPLLQQRLSALRERYFAARAAERADDDLPAIARASAAGRVEVLLIEADRRWPGRLDAATGAIADGDPDHPRVDDVLDDLAELVLRRGGEVIVMPAQRMPSATGVAAIHRYGGATTPEVPPS